MDWYSSKTEVSVKKLFLDTTKITTIHKAPVVSWLIDISLNTKTRYIQNKRYRHETGISFLATLQVRDYYLPSIRAEFDVRE